MVGTDYDPPRAVIKHSEMNWAGPGDSNYCIIGIFIAVFNTFDLIPGTCSAGGYCPTPCKEGLG